jgi:hypothetical protein
VNTDKFATYVTRSTWGEINTRGKEMVRVMNIGTARDKHLKDIAFVNQNARGK